MMMRFAGIIENGRLKLLDQMKFKNFISSKFKEGQKVSVVIQPERRIRSTGKKDEPGNQNGYYWAVIVRIAGEYCGYSDKEMHHAFGILFRLREGSPGMPMTMISTSEMTTTQFMEYCEQCRIWCAQQGLIVPDPKEFDYDKVAGAVEDYGKI